MLGGRHLAGIALDQRDHVFAGEPTILNAKARSLRILLRPVGEAPDRRVEEPKQAARLTVVDFSPQTRRPSLRPGFADPSHSHNRVTLATYTHATYGSNSPLQPCLKRPFVEPAVDTPLSKGFGSSVESLFFPLFAGLS
jgi:hypothetical protein